MHRLTVGLASTFLLCAACGDAEEEEELTEKVRQDPGMACIAPDAEVEPKLKVLITDTCFSGSARNMVAECTAEFHPSSNEVRVTATYTFDIGETKTDDCNNVETTCLTHTAVPPGSVSLAYDGDSVSFDVPLSGSVCSSD